MEGLNVIDFGNIHAQQGGEHRSRSKVFLPRFVELYPQSDEHLLCALRGITPLSLFDETDKFIVAQGFFGRRITTDPVLRIVPENPLATMARGKRKLARSGNRCSQEQ